MTHVASINGISDGYLYNIDGAGISTLKSTDDESIFAYKEEAAEVEISDSDSNENKDEDDEGFFDKLGNFFSNIGSAIKTFFAGLFGKNEPDEEDKDNKDIQEENTDTVTNDDNNTKEEVNKAIARDIERDEEIPEIVVQKYGMLADDIYYNQNGEIVIAIKTSGVADLEVGFGEICGKFYDDDGEEYFAIVLNDSKEDNTKNGKIENVKQGDIGDCWLLSAVNSLSYSENGRKIIKDALEYQDDKTIVHLKGAKDYTVTDDELKTAKLSGQYSEGDNDMIIMELAVEKLYKDIEDGKIDLEYRPANQEFDSLDGGTNRMAFEIITGKQSEIYESDKTIEKWLTNTTEFLEEYYPTIKASVAIDKFEADNNKDMVLCVGTGSNDKEVTDVDGNTVCLSGYHAYSIKEVKSDNVVITDPYNSEEEIVLPRKTAARAFDTYTLCDLSND